MLLVNVPGPLKARRLSLTPLTPLTRQARPQTTSKRTSLKSTLSLAVVALASALSLAATAHAVENVDIVVAQATAGGMADGEIRKVDKETKKITIKHGEIKNLDMPGMTMLFQVKDPAMLDMVKPGDKVKFMAEKAGGAIVVTEIQVIK